MKKEKFILSARAESDGIIVYECYRVEVGFKATVNQATGEISRFRITNNISESLQIMNAAYNFNPLNVSIMVAIWMISLGVSIYLNQSWFSMAVLYFISFVWFNCNWAVKSFFGILKQKPEEVSQARFHGAIHKALNAYEVLERIPTCSEVQEASIYSKNCKSYCFLMESIIFLIVDCCYILQAINLISTLTWVIILTVMFIGTKLKLKSFQVLEKIILLEPGEKEILCAIEALKEYEAYKAFN